MPAEPRLIRVERYGYSRYWQYEIEFDRPMRTSKAPIEAYLWVVFEGVKHSMYSTFWLTDTTLQAYTDVLGSELTPFTFWHAPLDFNLASAQGSPAPCYYGFQITL